MHPRDLLTRGLNDGEMVCVRSRVGQVTVEVRASEDMMAGVVSLPHGWGHGRAGVRLQTAQRHPGVSLNDLTDDQRLDALSGNAAFNAVTVTVEAACSTSASRDSAFEL
jgi:anaerobic selenocysteine-containing dehydrogenase